MGAYLTAPVVEKLSEDDRREHLEYGASCMQGWRISQEDAHNCVLDFDEDSSLFAVYDGHGGSEVAQYCALYLPDFIKNIEAYKTGNISQAMEDAFLGMDELLTKDGTIEELKALAGLDTAEEEAVDTEETRKSLTQLQEEACMPIEKLISQCYGGSISADTLQNLQKKDYVKQSLVIKAKTESKVEENTEDIKAKLDEKLTVNGKTDDSGVHDSEAGFSGSAIQETVSSSSGKKDTSESSSSKDSASSSSHSLSNGPDSGVGSSCSSSSASVAVDDEQPCSSGTQIKVPTKPVVDDEDNDDDDDDEESSEDDYVAEDDDDDDDEDDDDEDEETEETALLAPFMKSEKEEPGSDSGCTAVVAIVRKGNLYVANAGDSRCVICRDREPVDMSFDHKPEDEIEIKRITNAGGKIAEGRVNGGLNLSRALGDHVYKQNKDLDLKSQMITALPDVRSCTLTDKDQFMVIACDGIWNSMTSKEVVDFVTLGLMDKEGEIQEDVKLSKICEDLFDNCLADSTMNDGTGCDNMTCIIVRFKEQKVDAVSSSKRLSSDADKLNSEAVKKQKLT